MTMDSIMLLYWLVYLGTTYYRAKTMCSKLLKYFSQASFPVFNRSADFQVSSFFFMSHPLTKCYLGKCRSNTAIK